MAEDGIDVMICVTMVYTQVQGDRLTVLTICIINSLSHLSHKNGYSSILGPFCNLQVALCVNM